MATGAHDGNGSLGRTSGANTARGIAVIVAAIVVGLLLMTQGLGDDGGTASADSDTTETQATAEGEVATEDTTAAGDGTVAEPADGTQTTDPAVEELVPVTARPAAEVKVLVLNGTNGIQGAAGRGTAVMAAAGYITADAKDADVDGASLVLYVEGYEAEAIAVAQAFGVADPAQVVQPFDIATTPIGDTQSSHIVVRIGSDSLIQV